MMNLRLVPEPRRRARPEDAPSEEGARFGLRVVEAAPSQRTVFFSGVLGTASSTSTSPAGGVSLAREMAAS